MCGGIQPIVHESLFDVKFNFYVSNKEKIFNIVGLPMSLLQILHFLGVGCLSIALMAFQWFLIRRA